MANSITYNPEIRDLLMEQGATDATKCYQCGRCMPACPLNLLAAVNYVVYQFPQGIKLGTISSSEEKIAIEKEMTEIFRCIGCDSCRHECPRGVNISDILRAVRRIFIDSGSYPSDLKSFVSRFHNTGNPLGEPAAKRIEWTAGTGVERFRTGHEYLYFPCCVPSYDRRAQLVAQATARLFAAAGLGFGIIGEEEVCCGEAIRRAGGEKIFQSCRQKNLETFDRVKPAKVVTTSPHCHTIFKKEYAAFRPGTAFVHATQVFDELIAGGRLRFKNRFEKKVVYHDPCTLGRQTGVYEEPRRVLASVPGLVLKEVPTFNRQYSVCCGGGAMGLWREWSHDERLAVVRLRQLIATGAEVIAVACPYCLQMFEETLKSMDTQVAVMDVAEIMCAAL